MWMAVTLAWACTTTPPLPPLPEPVHDGSAEVVRVQLREAWTKADADPTNAVAVGEFGEVLLAYSQFDGATSCFRRCRLLEPESFRWAYLLGVAEASLGRSDAASRALSEALTMRPGDLAAAIRLSDLLEQSGEKSQAREVLEKALEAAPRSSAALYRLGRLLAGREPGLAIGHLEAALEVEPGYREALYALANAYRAEDREDDAEEQLRLYEQADPAPRRHYADPLIDSLDSVRRESAQAVFNEGHSLQERGEITAARAAYESVLEIDPDYVQAHVNLVSVFGQMGDPDQARRHYQLAVALDPGIAEAHYNYGVSLHFARQYEEAEQAFRSALAINDQNADAQGNLATTLEQLGRSAEAERHYRLALQNNPSHPMANFHLGRRFAERGLYRQAVPYLERAIATDSPGTALHGYLLAIVHRELGDFERASEVARAAQRHARSQNQAQLAEKIAAEFRP